MTVRELDQVISSLENITIYEPDGKVIVKLDRSEESATLEAFGDFVVDEIQYNPTAKCFGLYLKFKRVYEKGV